MIGAMTDGELADTILRKVAADRDTCILVERYPKGGISGLIDTSWFTLTEEEADYLDSLPDE